MGYSLTITVVILLSVLMSAMMTLIDFTFAQEFCARCSGDYRFEPQITDFRIINNPLTESLNDSCNNCSLKQSIVAVWNKPSSCCDVCYQVDVLSLSNSMPVEELTCHDMLNMTITNNNTVFWELDGEVCILQVSAKYNDGVVIPGPCHFVNVTKYHNMIYHVPKYSSVSIKIVFNSCSPVGGTFVPPSYELNGMVIYGIDQLRNYINLEATQDGMHYFKIPNATENIVLLEYCVSLSETSICGICQNSRRDILLSRSEVIVYSRPVSDEVTVTVTQKNSGCMEKQYFVNIFAIIIIAVIITCVQQI